MRKIVHLFLFFVYFNVNAQFCQPTTTNYCCGFGITNVTFSTINTNSQNASVGYEDFTSIQTTLTAGNTYPISIKTDVPSEHSIRVWIDYNNDSLFSPVSELVFLADKVFNGTGNITLPLNSVQDKPLRMRISADFYQNSPPMPCANLKAGQAEDYTVIIKSSSMPPVASFFSNDTVSCTGVVKFFDNSSNNPTKWRWKFGDNLTNSLQNPTHTYTKSGTYTVSLVTTNTFGGDSVEKINYVTITLENQVKTPSCQPTTASHCCGNGIYTVQLNTISNQTAGGENGYIDYACSQNTTLEAGKSYFITVSTGVTNPEDIKVWIDFNDNGIFETTSEEVFSSVNKKIHTGSVLISSSAIKNKLLRMRIMSDATGNAIDPCTDVLFGQTEDYGIKIIDAFVTPTAEFNVDSTSTCIGNVVFTDLSTNNPTGWLWAFGDSETSNEKSPKHLYKTNGKYTVKLTVTNPAGTNTITKTDYIAYDPSKCNTTIYEEAKKSFKIYPNPLSDFLFIESDNVKKYRYLLMNTIGQSVIPNTTTTNNKVKIAFEGFNKGLYFLMIYDENTLVKTEKVMILN